MSDRSAVVRPTLLPSSADEAKTDDTQPQQEQHRRDIYTTQCQPHNEELQASVHNSCGAIYPLQAELAELMSGWSRRWNSWCEDNKKQVLLFDEELAYFSKVGYDDAKLDESYACHLKAEWLGQYLKKIKAVQKAAEEEKRQQAEKEEAARLRRFDGLSEEEAEALRQEFLLAEEEERNNQPPLSPNSAKKAVASNNRRISFGGLHDDLARHFLGPVKRANMTAAVEDVNETLFPLEGHQLVRYTLDTHDNGQADPLNLLRAEFAKSLAVVAANETQLAMLGRERDGLITQERVTEAEAKTKAMIDLFTDTLHIVYSRFKQSVVAGVDVNEFGEHVTAVARETEARLTDARRDADEVKQRSSQDLQNLRDLMKKNQETARQQLVLFESRRDDSNNRLKQNTTDQQTAWATIMNQLTKLKDLCHERESLISDRMLATEKEQERLQLNNEIDAVCAAREDDLLAVLDNAKQALEYTTSVATLSQTVENAVKEKQFPEKLKKYQVEEALRFSDIYRRYALFSGRALFLRQQRLENIRRLVRQTDFQIQSAAETLDSDLPVYRTQVAAFRQSEEVLKNESSSLSDQIQKEAELWDEVEQFLDEANVTIEQPPTLAVQELQRDILRNHIEAVDQLATTEQKLLDGEKAHVRRMHNACVAAKDVIQEKSRNRSSLMISPSPTSASAAATPSKAADASISASPINYNQ